MQVFVNIFLLTGVILGIVLNFAPELFNGVAIKSSAAPSLAEVVASVAHPTSELPRESSNGANKSEQLPVLVSPYPCTMCLFKPHVRPKL